MIKVKCKNCSSKEGIYIPEFTQSEKKHLSTLNIESPMRTIDHLVHHYKISHGEAKFITLHINKTYGKCNRCDFTKLNEEYTNCQKCNALNLNWSID